MTTFRVGWLRRLLRSVHASERGIGLVGVLMMGATLAAVSAVVATRGTAQFNNAKFDTCWESALTAAESALNWGAATIDADPTFYTASSVPSSFVGTSDERTAAIAAAELVAEIDMLTTTHGEAAFMRAEDSDTLYGVGFCAARDDENRTVRVVRITLSEALGASLPWAAEYAFLSGEDLDISGNPEFGDPEVLGANQASVHANGIVDATGNVTFHSGCLTASSGGSTTGNVQIFGFCPPPAERFYQPVVQIPEVVPRAIWYLAEYDMCPDGTVRVGPAHPTLATLAGSVGSEPCLGHTLESDASTSTYRAFKMQSSSGGVASWTRSGNDTYNGSYYFHHGSVAVSGNAGSPGDPWRVTLIASSLGSCPNNLGGDISTLGNLNIVPYQPSTSPVRNEMVLIAGRDITASGNGSIFVEPGVIAAHEQIRYTGNVQVDGSFVAQHACDTVGSPLSVSSMHGNAKIKSDNPLNTFLTIPGEYQTALRNWTELR